MVRAKFRCNSVEDFGNDRKRVKLGAVYSNDIQSEDGRFTKATPWGEMTMDVDNPAAAVQFVPGKSYYFDVSPAE